MFSHSAFPSAVSPSNASKTMRILVLGTCADGDIAKPTLKRILKHVSLRVSTCFAVAKQDNNYFVESGLGL